MDVRQKADILSNSALLSHFILRVLTMQSGRNLIILFVGMVVFANGCKDKSNYEERLVKQMSINFCEELLEKPNLPRETAKLARKVLKMRNNSVIEAEPVMVRAVLAQPNRMDIVVLAVGVSDEN